MEILDPPTTHLIANIDDLIEVPVGGTEEMEYLEEETGESADSRPLAAVPLRPWQATSFQEWYMVDTPNTSHADDLEDPHYEMPGGEDEEQHTEEPTGREGNDKDIRALDIPLGSPRHDHARLRIMKSLGKVSRKKCCLERRANELDSEQYQAAEQERKTTPTVTKAALALKGRRMKDAMKNAIELNSSSY